tara:strand:+ start:15050 stop:15484 length:435 start_codon:yes stop_codon:yes gene_type:complete
MAYKLNGKILKEGVAFRDSNGTQYPSKWLANSTPSSRAAAGITEIADYDERFYSAPDTPKPIADLKSDWTQTQKNTARKLLTDTDWMVIREKEGGSAVPSNITTHRTAIRTKCKAREDQIAACADTDALAKLIKDDALEAWPTL